MEFCILLVIAHGKIYTGDILKKLKKADCKILTINQAIKDKFDGKIILQADEKFQYSMLKKLKIESLGNNRYALYVRDNEIPRILGKQGKRISALEDELGVSLDVRS